MPVCPCISGPVLWVHTVKERKREGREKGGEGERRRGREKGREGERRREEERKGEEGGWDND